MYNRRTKVDPLWNSLLVAGITPPSDAPMVTLPTTLAPTDATAPVKKYVSQSSSSTPTEPKSQDKLEGNLFLGYVDLYGTSFSGPHIATYTLMHTYGLTTVVMQSILLFPCYERSMGPKEMTSIPSPKKRQLA